MLTDVIVTVLIYNRCVIIMYFYIAIFKTVLKVKGKHMQDVWGILFHIALFFSEHLQCLCSPLKKQFHQLRFSCSSMKV